MKFWLAVLVVMSCFPLFCIASDLQWVWSSSHNLYCSLCQYIMLQIMLWNCKVDCVSLKGKNNKSRTMGSVWIIAMNITNTMQVVCCFNCFVAAQGNQRTDTALCGCWQVKLGIGGSCSSTGAKRPYNSPASWSQQRIYLECLVK